MVIFQIFSFCHERGTNHVHQAKILRYPQNQNFISLLLFIRIHVIFFVLGNNQFLKLMGMRLYPNYKIYGINSVPTRRTNIHQKHS
ncbi:hypothetical protein EXW62_27615 (plasmid) [Bacillus mycoides]|nr:hypothetical protein EXW62_27615 [Bacillus mycoides]